MNYYVPVLKTKSTSFKALKYLKPGSKNVIIPLFEVVPDTELDIEKNLNTFWKGLRCYLDFVFLDGDGVGDIINHVTTTCREAGHDIILVTGPDRTKEYQETVKSLSEEKDIAIRFPLSSMDGLRSNKIVNGYFEYLRKDNANIHVFLDMEEVKGEAEYFAAGALIQIIKRPQLARFCIVGGAFPGSEDLIEYKNSIATIPRYDYLLWKEIRASGVDGTEKICYGDYTIRDIDLPYSGFTTHQIPTLRYTLESEFYIHRGISNRKHERGMYQFNDECYELIRKDYYRGKEFSFGDQQIYEKGTELHSSPGSSATWALIGVNQHIEFVVSQLAN